jgi:membrane AbrB-like protein
MPWRIVLTLLLALGGGLAAVELHMPLPWMLGPLLAVAAGCMCGAGLQAMPGGRKAGQWAIGSALGLYFTPPVLAQLGSSAPLIVAAAAGSLLIGVVCAVLMHRLAGVDAPTAFFAALPGGASEMATLAERWGGAVDRIAAAHALRVLLVVSSVPFALTLAGAHGTDAYAPLARGVDWMRLPLLVGAGFAGAALLVWMGVANAWVLGPLFGVGLVTACNVSLSALPPWAVNGGQLLIGCSLGSRFSPGFFRAAPRFVSVAAVSCVLAIGLSFLLALLLAALASPPLATLALATAPGGVSEMCITAKVLQLGVPLVTATHVLRVVVLTLGAAPAFRCCQHFLKGVRPAKLPGG